MARWVLLCVVLAVAAMVEGRGGGISTNMKRVRVDDPVGIYFTEQNWYIPNDGSYALAANPGSYIKLAFSGTQVWHS